MNGLGDVEVVVEAVGRSAGRCRASPPGTAPAPPGPSRARSSAAGCRGRRRLSIATGSTTSPSASSWARSRSSPPTRAAITCGVVGEQLPRLGARGHRALAGLGCVQDGDVDVGHGARLLGTAERPVVRGRAGRLDRIGRVRTPVGTAAGRDAARAAAVREGGRYWARTSDLFGVNEARYHCANRPVDAPDVPVVGAPETVAHRRSAAHIDRPGRCRRRSHPPTGRSRRVNRRIRRTLPPADLERPAEKISSNLFGFPS